MGVERGEETKPHIGVVCVGGPGARLRRPVPLSFQLCEGLLWSLSSRWEEAAQRRLISSNSNRPVIDRLHYAGLRRGREESCFQLFTC